MVQDAAFQITYAAGAEPPVTITPLTGPILGQGSATWQIDASGYDVAIVFASSQCPFPPAGEAPSGVYRSAGTPISTLPARYDTNGDWKYTVTLTSKTKGGSSPPPADGTVVIKENP